MCIEWMQGKTYDRLQDFVYDVSVIFADSILPFASN